MSDTVGWRGLRLNMANQGASLSVTFHNEKFPDLLGWAAYEKDVDRHPLSMVLPLVEEKQEPIEIRYPKFTERNGQFAPFKKATARPERQYDDHNNIVDGVHVSFDEGTPYSRRLLIII